MDFFMHVFGLSVMKGVENKENRFICGTGRYSKESSYAVSCKVVRE